MNPEHVAHVFQSDERVVSNVIGNELGVWKGDEEVRFSVNDECGDFDLSSLHVILLHRLVLCQCALETSLVLDALVHNSLELFLVLFDPFFGEVDCHELRNHLSLPHLFLWKNLQSLPVNIQ